MDDANLNNTTNHHHRPPQATTSMSKANFVDDERFDPMYMHVSDTARGIEPMLDTVFSFRK